MGNQSAVTPSYRHAQDGLLRHKSSMESILACEILNALSTRGLQSITTTFVLGILIGFEMWDTYTQHVFRHCRATQFVDGETKWGMAPVAESI